MGSVLVALALPAVLLVAGSGPLATFAVLGLAAVAVLFVFDVHKTGHLASIQDVNNGHTYGSGSARGGDPSWLRCDSIAWW